MKPLFFISLVIFLSACKKDKEATPNIPSCKIATATQTDNSTTTTYNLTYDVLGRLAKVDCTGSDPFTKTFTYNGDSIFVNVPEGPHASSAVITLNSFKLISTRKLSFQNSLYDASYNYDSNGQLISLAAIQGTYIFPIINYTNTNGDITNTTSQGITDTTSFYNDKTSVLGSLDDFGQLINYGAFYNRNKHLMKSYQNGTNRIDYSYTFDSKGNISSVISNYNGTNYTTMFTYTCD